MANETRERVTVVAVLSDDQDRQALQGIFAHSNWELRITPTLATATRLLHRSSAGILIVGEPLPETGSWREALEFTRGIENHPLVIVASRLADERLWAEVLNIGAYDVLATPFDPPEVYRVVSFAWQTWRRLKQVRPPVEHSLAVATASF